jgi:8-oxo-dGTP diphosphatase
VRFAPILTERMGLRPFEAAEALALRALLDDPEVARHSPGLAHPYGLDAAARWIAQARPPLYAGEEFLLGCFGRDSGALLGVAKLALDPARPEAELGYWFGRAHWRRGLATEAVQRLVAFAFDTLGLARLRAGVLDGNPASARVLGKAGLETCGSGEIAGCPATFYALDAAQRPKAKIPGPPLVYAAAVALIDDHGRVLLARRPAGKAMAGLWEFPGGKVEAGERPRPALARELAEELAIEVALRDLWPFAIASHRYARFQLLMPLMLCRRWGGNPRAREGQSFAWVSGGALTNYPMPAADAPLVTALRPLLAP